MSSNEEQFPGEEGGTRDPMSGSLSMSASSSTIAAALSSSANMGGKAVTISLPTQTPLKSAHSTPGRDGSLSQTTPMTEGASARKREAAVDSAMAALDSATSKSVTINEKQNMEQFPSSSAYIDKSAAMPALKDAGAEGQRLESRTSPSTSKPGATSSPSPSPVKPKKMASPSPAKSKEITDQERAKAKYLLNRAYHSGEQNSRENDARRDNDRYSSYSGSSGGSYGSKRSVKTTESEIARRLRKSQQRLRDSQERGRGRGGADSHDVALQAVFSSLTEQQQALFMSMKDTKTTGGASLYDSGPKNRSRSGSPDAKSVSSYNETRSSRSGGSSRRGGGGRGKRPSSASASASSSVSSAKSTVRLSTNDMHKVADRLTKPVHVEPSAEAKKADPTLKYLLIDEAKHCGRKPFKAKKWAGSNRADDDPDAKSNFVERMANQEYHRIEEMEHKRAAADYNALLTRKECPVCGTKQKYDEVKDKKNVCPNCEVEYRPKITWGQVGHKFFDRTAKNAEMSQAKQEELIKHIEEERQPKKTHFDAKTGKVVTVAAPANKKKWTSNTKEAFFERMSEHEEKAASNLKKIEDESFGKQCTFMPQTGKKDEDEDDENSGVQAFLRRLDEEAEERKQKMPHLFSEKFKPDPQLAGKAKWVPT